MNQQTSIGVVDNISPYKENMASSMEMKSEVTFQNHGSQANSSKV